MFTCHMGVSVLYKPAIYIYILPTAVRRKPRACATRQRIYVPPRFLRNISRHPPSLAIPVYRSPCT